MPKELLFIVIRVRARILRNKKMVDIVKKLGSSGLELKTSKAPLKLDNIIKSWSVKSYGEIKCVLDGSCSPDEFNIWSGFQAKRVSLETESEGFKLMKSFIMDLFPIAFDQEFSEKMRYFMNCANYVLLNGQVRS